MKNLKIYASLLGGVLFQGLFWGESLGLNGLIFTAFLILGLFALNREINFSKYAWVAAGGLLLSSVLMVWHNALPAKLAMFASAFLLVGFSEENRLRSIMYASLVGIQNFFTTIGRSYQSIEFSNSQRKDLQLAMRYLKLFVLPLFVALIFLALFRGANPVFAELTDSFFNWMGDSFAKIFELLSPIRLIVLLFGAYFSAWFFVKKGTSDWAISEQSQPEQLMRNADKPATYQKRDFSPIGLKNENRVASVMMTMVALMATMVNVIDVQTIWFNFEYNGEINLSQFVHEGTYLLIFSILLSMGIMLYFFRGNQNFYLKNERLKWLAYLWITQNMLMVVSVAIRNYHYIHHFGLAYKRIGVLFFLGLTLFGLVTLTLKIRDKKSTFYLLRMNSWATYAMLFMLALVNWDVLIAKHNTQHQYQENMDLKFLLSLSDKALPTLHAQKASLKDKIVFQGRDSDSRSFNSLLNARIQAFLQAQQGKSWQSWTHAEWQASEYFREAGVKLVERD